VTAFPLIQRQRICADRCLQMGDVQRQAAKVGWPRSVKWFLTHFCY